MDQADPGWLQLDQCQHSDDNVVLLYSYLQTKWLINVSLPAMIFFVQPWVTWCVIFTSVCFHNVEPTYNQWSVAWLFVCVHNVSWNDLFNWKAWKFTVYSLDNIQGVYMTKLKMVLWHAMKIYLGYACAVSLIDYIVKGKTFWCFENIGVKFMMNY